MAFNGEKTREWKSGSTPATGTPALGELFDAEFNRLYENDNVLANGTGIDDKAIKSRHLEDNFPFASIPVLPDNDPTQDNHIPRKVYVDAKFNSLASLHEDDISLEIGGAALWETDILVGDIVVIENGKFKKLLMAPKLKSLTMLTDMQYLDQDFAFIPLNKSAVVVHRVSSTSNRFIKVFSGDFNIQHFSLDTATTGATSKLIPFDERYLLMLYNSTHTYAKIYRVEPPKEAVLINTSVALESNANPPLLSKVLGKNKAVISTDPSTSVRCRLRVLEFSPSGVSVGGSLEYDPAGINAMTNRIFCSRSDSSKVLVITRASMSGVAYYRVGLFTVSATLTLVDDDTFDVDSAILVSGVFQITTTKYLVLFRATGGSSYYCVIDTIGDVVSVGPITVFRDVPLQYAVQLGDNYFITCFAGPPVQYCIYRYDDVFGMVYIRDFFRSVPDYSSLDFILRDGLMEYFGDSVLRHIGRSGPGSNYIMGGSIWEIDDFSNRRDLFVATGSGSYGDTLLASRIEAGFKIHGLSGLIPGETYYIDPFLGKIVSNPVEYNFSVFYGNTIVVGTAIDETTLKVSNRIIMGSR